MTVSPEIKNGLPVSEIPQEFPEVPVEVENKSFQPQPVPSQFKAQVNDDKGVPLIQTPQNQVVTVEIPTDQATLTSQAKGSTDDSSTWSAAWFLRLIKRALHFGWKIVLGRSQNGTTTN